MSSEHPETAPGPEPVFEPPAVGDDRPPTELDHPSPPPVISSGRLWLFALAAAVAAGFLSWLGGEAVVDTFKPKIVFVSAMGMQSPQPDPVSVRQVEVKNALLAFTILGAVLGLTLGLAGGLARGSFRAATSAGIGGLVIGAVAAALATVAVVPVYQHLQRRMEFDPASVNLAVPLLGHGATWGIVGAAAGLGFGLGLGGRGRAFRSLVGGLLGAFVGAAIYEIVGAAAFPLDNTFMPISETPSSRLLARLAVAVCTAVGAVLACEVSGHAADSLTPASQPAQPEPRP
jgi:hypothetical protein